MPLSSSKFETALSAGRDLSIQLPDSRLVADAYRRAFESSEPWLFHHVVRSWLYSVSLAKVRGLSPDQELLAVAVLLHDLGLAQGGSADCRFEVVGAELGRSFALQHGMDQQRAEVVWDAIALHTTASIAHFKGDNVASCQFGIACDFAGFDYNQLSERTQQIILEAYPRLHFKDELSSCVCAIAKMHPESTWESFIVDFGMRLVPGYRPASSVEALFNSPFPD